MMCIGRAFAILALTLSVLSCGPLAEGPQRTYENGVEVVTNGFEPYATRGETDCLRLEKSLVIDLESPDVAPSVIPRITSFDVDSHGNIYVWSHRASENFVIKFDSSARFDRAFGRSGQGPGEIEALSYVALTGRDEVVISDHGRDRMIVMSASGTLLREMRLPAEADLGTLLPNGNVLAWRTQYKPKDGVDTLQVVIFDQQLDELAVLGPTENLPDWARVRRINPLQTNPTLGQGSISGGRIYVGNKQSGYEISVYDLEGKPIRKIRKAYRPVAVPEDITRMVLEVFDMPRHKGQKGKLYFPDSLPPFQYFFPDDQGRLFVMTFEKGETPGSYLYDIFNPDGVFVGRTSLDNSGNEDTEIWGGPFEVRAKNERLYYLRAKESGFQELVVCRMIWFEK